MFGQLVKTSNGRTYDGMIASIDKSLCLVPGQTRSLQYLCQRQNSSVAYTPVYGKQEKQLFYKLIMDLIGENHSFSTSEAFTIMKLRWDRHATGENGIMMKDEEHLVHYYKDWKKTRVRNDVIKSTKVTTLTSALLHTTPALTFTGAQNSILHPLQCRVIPEHTVNHPVLEHPENEGEASLTDTQATSAPANSIPEPVLQNIAPKRICSNKDCFIPNCPGVSFKGACKSRPVNERIKRKKPTCKVENCPNPDTCTGKNNRSRCPMYKNK